MDLQNALNEFLLACEADGLSDVTLRWYRAILTPLCSWLGMDRDIQQVDTTELRKYIVRLRGRHPYDEGNCSRPEEDHPLSEHTVVSHTTAMHRLFNWASQEYDINNPMSRIKRKKWTPKEPKAINQIDFLKLFHATTDDSTGARDRAILCVLADTGARLGGVASLTVDDIEKGTMGAYVTEKGNKKRWIYWTAYTQAILNTWLGQRMDVNPALWISMNTGEQLTTSGIYQILKRLKARAGIKGRVNPHAFRHNFARCYLEAGGDIATLAKLMGHSDINTTASYYAVFSEGELKDLHNKKAPLLQWLNLSQD